MTCHSKHHNTRGNKHFSWFPLLSTNFLGVFNDNLLKNLASFISIYWIGETHRTHALSAAAAMLVIPYILFSPGAGILSRIRQKTWVVRFLKMIEIPIMVAAGYGFIIENIWLVLAGIFMMGIQSCLYSPAKYGLIRDIGGNYNISYGTGALEMSSFAAILSGQFLASLLSDQITNPWWLWGLMVFIAISGYLTSLTIKAKESLPDPKTKESLNPVKFMWQSYHFAKTIPGLNTVILGLCIFWLMGSMLQLNLYQFGPGILGLSNTQTGMIMAGAAIGIAGGSYLAGLLSHHKIRLKMVFVAAIVISSLFLLIGLVPLPAPVFAAIVFLIALSGGFYKVPLNAWIQARVQGRYLGDMIAYLNLSAFLFILLSAVLFDVIEQFLGKYAVFLFLSLSLLVMFIILLKNRKKYHSQDEYLPE